MELNNLSKIKGKMGKSKRVGRGYGSGKGGHTVGKGTKGQKARQGRKPAKGFEGGQVPLYKRLPQIGGFVSHTRKDVISVNIENLNVFKEGDKVSPKDLLEKGIIKRLPKFGVKLLAKGSLEKKLTLQGFMYSEQAKAKAEKSDSEILE